MSKKLNIYYLTIFIYFIAQNSYPVTPEEMQNSLEKINEKYNTTLKTIEDEQLKQGEESLEKYLSRNQYITNIRDKKIEDEKHETSEKKEQRKIDLEEISKIKEQKTKEVDSEYRDALKAWIDSGKSIFLTELNTRADKDDPHPHHIKTKKMKTIEKEFKGGFDRINDNYDNEVTKRKEQYESTKKDINLEFEAEYLNEFIRYNNEYNIYQDSLQQQELAARKKHSKALKKIEKKFYLAHPELKSKILEKDKEDTKAHKESISSLALIAKGTKPTKQSKKRTFKRKASESSTDHTHTHDHTYDLRAKQPRTALSKVE